MTNKATILVIFTLMLAAAVLVVAFLANPVRSSGVDIPNTFSAGTPAVADEVNANFAVLQSVIVELQNQVASLESELDSAVSSLESELGSANNTISSLESDMSDLEGQVSGINGSAIMALGSHLEEISSNNFAFSGINLHLRNGQGQTDSSNSLGNLIIGYNEPRPSSQSQTVRTGSHRLVVGAWHNWSSYGGLVAGFQNTVSGAYSNVSGGENNTASGGRSSVSGGLANEASGGLSSVSGGALNEAGGGAASVSGGAGNEASGIQSSILGGSSITVTSTNGHHPE